MKLFIERSGVNKQLNPSPAQTEIYRLDRAPKPKEKPCDGRASGCGGGWSPICQSGSTVLGHDVRRIYQIDVCCTTSATLRYGVFQNQSSIFSFRKCHSDVGLRHSELSRNRQRPEASFISGSNGVQLSLRQFSKGRFGRHAPTAWFGIAGWLLCGGPRRQATAARSLLGYGGQQFIDVAVAQTCQGARKVLRQ